MKRSGFARRVKPLAGGLRTTLLPAPAKPKLAAKPKTRKCQVCPTRFVSRGMAHVACSAPCALEVAKRKREKLDRQAEKLQRADLARRKEAIKTVPELKKEAQAAFNAFIRFRDRRQPCICCDQFPKADSLTGGSWDAGHYRSTGSADHLRFDERNVHRQLKRCNQFGAGRAVDYRVGLIKRLGLAAVEALESDQTVIKWTREMLLEIRDSYRAKLKQLQAQEKLILLEVPAVFPAAAAPAKETA